jgi:3'(2'), 5'-bisphosphate nucleotidase
MYRHELAVALAATQIAAELCQRVQASVTAQALEKRDKSPVTVADFASQAIIAAALKRVFPEIPLIAEEDSAALRSADNSDSLQRVVAEVQTALDDQTLSTDTVCEWIDHGGASEYSDLFWTLDPIDGTKGFLRGEQYAIALALVKDGQPVCATLACPNLANPDGSLGAVFTAQNGEANSVHSKGAEPLAIKVSPEADLARSRFCESVESAHSDHSQSKASNAR